jgi:hypothetical protein
MGYGYQMSAMRVGRLVAVLAVLAGTGIVGMIWGLSAEAAPLASGHATTVAHAVELSDNLPKLVVDGVQAKTITLQSSRSYTPHAAPGTYDDYHCTLINPHVTTSSFIVADQFFPESHEVHHSILFLVPPNLASAAEAANTGGNGWSCFGEAPIPGTSSIGFSPTPWLAAWAPGAPENIEPFHTGVPLPAGSLVIEQIHYNLLIGDKPVRAKLQLHLVPATTPLSPLHIATFAAPPDIPCPANEHGPLCNRAASLAYSAKQFGQSLITLVNVLESVCGRNPANPPAGDTTSCVWPVGQSGYIVRIAAHMHLLGVSMRVTLNPGTPQAKLLLNVPDYDFNYQRGYNMKTPVYVSPGDRVGVSCTYNPALRQKIPYTRDLAPQFITWGWGSADEMCLAIASISPAA